MEDTPPTVLMQELNLRSHPLLADLLGRQSPSLVNTLEILRDLGEVSLLATPATTTDTQKKWSCVLNPTSSHLPAVNGDGFTAELAALRCLLEAQYAIMKATQQLTDDLQDLPDN